MTDFDKLRKLLAEFQISYTGTTHGTGHTTLQLLGEVHFNFDKEDNFIGLTKFPKTL